MPLYVSSTRVHRQEAKLVLYNLWYHHTETSEWSKITKITKLLVILVILVILDHSLFFQCDDTRGCIVQF